MQQQRRIENQCAIREVAAKNDLLAWLTSVPDIFLFGGLVKHLINPSAHPTFTDIDVIATSPDVAEQLSANFGYRLIQVSRRDQYPRYKLGKSASHREVIQLLEMNSEADAKAFIYNAQYDIDRVSVSNQQLHFAPTIGESAALRGINEKVACRVPGPRDLRFFSPYRQPIEQRHKLKLLRKGFTVHDEVSTIPHTKTL
jgi:hypothetical protein